MDVLTLFILIMMWLLTLLIAFQSGISFSEQKKPKARKKSAVKHNEELSREELEEQNFYSYDGREQEPINGRGR